MPKTALFCKKKLKNRQVLGLRCRQLTDLRGVEAMKKLIHISKGLVYFSVFPFLQLCPSTFAGLATALGISNFLQGRVHHTALLKYTRSPASKDKNFLWTEAYFLPEKT